MALRLLEQRFPAAEQPLRFISDLRPSEIRFVESNDDEVWIYVTGGSSDEVTLADTILPVSRKYREKVRSLTERTDFHG